MMHCTCLDQKPVLLGVFPLMLVLPPPHVLVYYKHFKVWTTASKALK